MTDWNQLYLDGDIPWEKGGPAPPFEDMLKGKSMQGRALVPGCGFGHDARLLNECGLDVVGLDIAQEAVEVARMKSRFDTKISYLCDDFLVLNPSLHNQFDYVFEHTLFCAIEPRDRRRYVRSTATALKPHGLLVAIFYLDPDHDDPPPWGVTKEEIEDLFAAEFKLLKSWVPERAYKGREGRELVQLRRKLQK